MKIDIRIRDKKLQHSINRKTAKISGLSLDKNDKYEYLKGEEIFPSGLIQVIEQTKFTHLLLGKTFKKQEKNN